MLCEKAGCRTSIVVKKEYMHIYFYIREVYVCICTENIWDDVEQTVELLSLGIGIGEKKVG